MLLSFYETDDRILMELPAKTRQNKCSIKAKACALGTNYARYLANMPHINTN